MNYPIHHHPDFWWRIVAPTLAGLFAWLTLNQLTTRAGAQEEIVIEGSSAHSVFVRGIEGNFGNQATGTLREELGATSIVKLVNSPEGAFTVSGQADGKALVGTLNSPDGSVVFTKNYSGATLKGNVQQFAREVIAALGGETPNELAGSIVFVSNKTGKKELYVCGFDGSNVRRITNDNSINVSPSISADGTAIAHTSYVSGYADVYYLDLKAGSRQRIISSPGTNSGAAISPDGRRLALTMSFVGNPEIFVTNTRGGGAKRLTNTAGIETSPTWSPDGSRIAYSSDQGGSPLIYTVAASGGRPQRVNTGYRFCTEPNWSPDGARLAFCVRQGGSMAVAVHEFASGKTKVLGNGEDPCWGPDSQSVVFTRGGSLVVKNISTGDSKTIISGMGKVSEPSWSR